MDLPFAALTSALRHDVATYCRRINFGPDRDVFRIEAGGTDCASAEALIRGMHRCLFKFEGHCAPSGYRCVDEGSVGHLFITCWEQRKSAKTIIRASQVSWIMSVNS